MNLPNTDIYELLGVGQKADQKELKEAYKAMQARMHPDRWGRVKEVDSTPAAQEINEAYAILSNKGNRIAYDQHLAGLQARKAIEESEVGKLEGRLRELCGDSNGIQTFQETGKAPAIYDNSFNKPKNFL
jgi:DnaJ-class molecular chaperone